MRHVSIFFSKARSMSNSGVWMTAEFNWVADGRMSRWDPYDCSIVKQGPSESNISVYRPSEVRGLPITTRFLGKWRTNFALAGRRLLGKTYYFLARLIRNSIYAISIILHSRRQTGSEVLHKPDNSRPVANKPFRWSGWTIRIYENSRVIHWKTWIKIEFADGSGLIILK